MSKSDTPFDEIDKSRANGQLGKPYFAGDKTINGLDSETADGDIFALGVHYGESGEYVSKVGEEKPLGELEILEFLTSKGMRNSLNMWYNLNFDANVILKALGKDVVKDIQLHNTATKEIKGREWSFLYIPRKALIIDDGNQNKYAHFDAHQFTYSGGLESAAEDWLGIENGKLNEDIDPAKFGKLVGPLREGQERPLNRYTTDNMAEIKDYLEQDCKLTADIYREITDTAESLEPKVPMGKPFSTGYVAGDYIRNRLEYKPAFGSDRVQEAAWKAYRGGRFEVTKRGDVGRIYGPDINSAYPAVMADLPDPGTLEWEAWGDGNNRGDISEIGLSELEEADYGFVKVNVTTDPERPVQPFAVKNWEQGDRIEYPALNGVTTWVLKETFQYAVEADLILDYELRGAELGYEVDKTTRPFSFFKDLYRQRKGFEADGRDKPAKLIKIVMNSIYGKTCQTQMKQVAANKAHERLDFDHLEEGEFPAVGENGQPKVDGYKFVTDSDGKMYLEYAEAGRLFNPFLAAYITGKTRLQLLRGVVDNGLEDNVVMLATDSLMIEADAFESSELYAKAEYEPDDPADALGGWDYDYVGDGFVVGSGLYQVDRTDKDETKLGLRGFKDFYADDNDFDTLREAAEQNPEGVPITTTRPTTYGDILQKNLSLSQIGVFVKSKRELSADMDSKRSWENDSPTFPELLSGKEESLPKTLTGDTAAWETQDL